MLMLAIAVCLFGALAILLADEYLAKRKILKAKYRRNFVHITVGIFIASWPWLISWRTIQLIGVLMLAIVAYNRYHPVFKFNHNTKRETYGDFCFALAVIACASLTTINVFFALAMLELALADSIAALIGKKYGTKWNYKVFHQTKTVLGSMMFWVVTVYILGVGILFAHDLISYSSYAAIILLLPPVLTLLENITPVGLDDLVVPVTLIIVLGIAQTA